MKDPFNEEDEYNVGVELIYKSGTDPSRPENYTIYLEDAYEWEDINRILRNRRKRNDIRGRQKVL